MQFQYSAYTRMSLEHNRSMEVTKPIPEASMPRQIVELFRDPTVTTVVVMQTGVKFGGDAFQHVYSREPHVKTRHPKFEPIVVGSRSGVLMESPLESEAK
jgi:hypothetical protein